MPWRQPSETKTRLAPRRGAGRRALVASGAALFAAAVAWLAFSGGDASRGGGAAATRGRRAVRAAGAAAPRRAGTDVREASEARRAERRDAAPAARPPQRVGEVRDGYRLLCDGRLHRVLGVVTNAPGRFSVADRTFTHGADVELGNLLTVEPGDDLLGESAGMYRGFGEELDAALAEPIVDGADDTPEQREMKKAVRELRGELAARRARGEDVEKIMEDAREQLRELALYRRELEEEVARLTADGMAQEDYEALVAAANRMLAERGVKPLALPSTVRHAVRLRRAREAAAKEAAVKEAGEGKGESDAREE